MSDSRLQEIVTKAVVGRAERRMTWSHTVPADGITGVYGVHVTDSAVAVKEHNGRPVVDVIVDCDLWCGGQKHTKMCCAHGPHQRTADGTTWRLHTPERRRGGMVVRSQRSFTFRVTEREVTDPERVAQGLRVWADCLARRLLLQSAQPGEGGAEVRDGT